MGTALIVAQAVIAAITVDHAPLWRDLQTNMSPEQVAETLRKVEGIESAQVKRNRRGKFSELMLRYTGGGVVIDDGRMDVAPVFEGERLTALRLSNKGCAKAGAERLQRLRDALKDKYPNSARERVVDEEGVEFEQRVAFWNGDTRVRLSWSLDAPTVPPTSTSGRGALGALTGLANMTAQSSYEAALKECPTDAGTTVTSTITYSSQRSFEAEHAAEQRAREDKAKATRDGL